MSLYRIPLLLLLILWLLPGIAQAVLEIRITEGREGAMPIAIVPFGLSATAPPPGEDLAEIISANLHRSGQFSPLARTAMPQRPTQAQDIQFGVFRDRGMEYLVIGRIQQSGAERYQVEFELFDTLTEKALAGYAIPSTRAELRRTAHKISDLIFERITGKRGAFDTQIAYVSATRSANQRQFTLQIADADGHNPRTIFRSNEPLMSPAWSPDGQRLAYVSFENRRSEVYIQTISSGTRTLVASHPGINGAPAWSPDGRRLALALSKDGEPNIYVLDLASRQLRQLTQTRSIDTEPAWSPDGRSIIFTSDRAGNPQLYEVGLDGGQPRRLTFEGRYSGAADIAPDGRTLAFVYGDEGRFRIAALNRATQAARMLTQGRMDESPSFAPNGSMIIYATSDQGRGVLAAVSEDGRVHQRLLSQEGEVREPAWSPFLR